MTHGTFYDYRQRVEPDAARGAGPLMSRPMPGEIKDAGGGSKSASAVRAFGAGHDLAAMGLKAALYERDEDRALKATEIINTWKNGLDRFSAAYRQENQGETAKNAGAVFGAFARQSGRQALDGIRDAALRRMVMRGVAGAALRFEETGRDYGFAQTAAWKREALAGDRDRLLRTVGQDAGDLDFVNHQMADHLTRFRAAHPGLDTGAYEMELKREAVAVMLSSMEVNKDFTRMRELLRRAGGQKEGEAGILAPRQVAAWQGRIEAARKKDLEDREWAAASRLSAMPEGEAMERITNDPLLKDSPEARAGLLEKYKQLASMKKDLAEAGAAKQLSGVYAAMRTLKDAEGLDETSALRLALSLPPEKRAAAMSYSERLMRGDTVETDPRVFTEMVRGIGRGAPVNVAGNAGKISFTDQDALGNQQRAGVLASLLPAFEQAAARRGLNRRETEEAFTSFQRRVPAEGFKTQSDVDNAMFRDLNSVTLDKPWSVARTVRGYKAAEFAADGFYPGAGSPLTQHPEAR